VQNVALDATTLVIRNTQFGDGSTVALNSQLGKLAGNPGTGAGITRGMVNVVSGVYYGATEFKLPSTGDMDNAAFRAAATTAGKEALKNITIGGPKTATK
jgi:hypothetical protein